MEASRFIVGENVPEGSAVARFIVGDGRVAEVVLLTFGRGRACLLDDPDDPLAGYSDVWDYESVSAAFFAAMAWRPGEAEPSGWEKHPGTCRYRPDGDPAREYVRYPGRMPGEPA